jgi:predicted metal-binding membrane protein
VTTAAPDSPLALHPSGAVPPAHPAAPRRTWKGRRPTPLPSPAVIAIAAAWVAAIAAQAAGAAALVHHDALLVDGPSPVVATLAFLLSWQVMIAAMMLPSSLPLVRLFAAASSRAPARARAMAAFLGAYALVWSAFGLLAFALDAGLHAAVEASPWLHRHEWAIGGSVLALAGAFQFTSLKDACLDKCRHPAQFLTRYYRRGTAGAFELGARHSAFCVGCCWALMLVMFAAGMASLLWMAALTALMIHEKTRPNGARAVPVSGAALLATASVVLAYGAATGGVL